MKIRHRITGRSRIALVATALAVVSAQELLAQQTPASPVVQHIAPAKAEDVSTIAGIITALYGSISGPKGQARDWNRMRSLFVPEARLMPAVNRPGGGRGVAVLSVNDYIARSGQLLIDTGFREREVARKVEEFGNITHVFSTYESFRGDETAPFMRGINSIQLFNDGTRYWVLSVFWDAERPGLQIPAKYLEP